MGKTNVVFYTISNTAHTDAQCEGMINWKGRGDCLIHFIHKTHSYLKLGEYLTCTLKVAYTVL